MKFMRNRSRIFAILIFGLIAMEPFVASFVCDPNVSCILNNNGLNVSDPLDCARYYRCKFDNDNGYYQADPEPELCLPGTQFSPETAECEESTEECTSECCNCSGADIATIDCIDKLPGIYPVFCDCSSFYKCSDDPENPPPSLTICDEGYYFNEDINNCSLGSCGQEQIHYCPINTTTTTSTSTTTTATTTTGIYNPCQQTFSCPYDGNFKNCPYCHITFWHCYQETSTLLQCDTGYLFNTNDNYPFCFQSSNCPYP